MKNILIFSNPFGYGPTGKAIAVAISFKKRFPEYRVIFVGNEFSSQIVPEGIETFSIDERDENALFSYLSSFSTSQTIIFSSQNRFVVKISKSLNIPCAFLDGLAWFWKKIPDDHFLADIIFWLRYPGVVIPSQNKEKIVLVSGITGVVNSFDHYKNQILINISGSQNPLVPDLSFSYFNLFAFCLKKYIQTNNNNVTVTGGQKALDYLKKQFSSSDKINFQCLPHDIFIEKLSTCSHLITTAGQTATMEAYAYHTPVSFFLPMYLAHYSLTAFLSKYILNLEQLRWENYVSVNENISIFNEKEAIYEFEKYAELIWSNDVLKEKISQDFCNLINKVPVIDGQNSFIESLGTNGADEIVEFMANKFNI